jgi:cyclophilin family peptidyl-prolyl cis-trans isomerase
MSQQQTKKRRKRYEPGSAYAGHVRPKGVFGVFSNVRLFMIIGIVIMVGGLGAGGLFQSGLFGDTTPSGPQDFVRPEDNENGTPVTEAPAEVKQYDAEPAMTIDPTKTYQVTIKTDAGDIQAELFAENVPETVNNFVFLANDGFYEGLSFFVQPDFVAQTGDPTNEFRSVDEDAGYDLEQEAPAAFDEGTLAMVNSSQFFIALDGSDSAQFTPFGRITSGLEVARQITAATQVQSIEVQES